MTGKPTQQAEVYMAKISELQSEVAFLDRMDVIEKDKSLRELYRELRSKINSEIHDFLTAANRARVKA